MIAFFSRHRTLDGAKQGFESCARTEGRKMLGALRAMCEPCFAPFNGRCRVLYKECKTTIMNLRHFQETNILPTSEGKSGMATIYHCQMANSKVHNINSTIHIDAVSVWIG